MYVFMATQHAVLYDSTPLVTISFLCAIQHGAEPSVEQTDLGGFPAR